MAKKGPRNTIMLESASGYRYFTSKNSRNSPDKKKLRKFDPNVRQHVEFTEGKMK